MMVRRPGSLAKDEILYHQSRPADLLFQVQQGYLITHVMNPSRDVGLSIYGPGDIVGTPHPHTEYLDTAQAITPVTYVQVPNDGKHLHLLDAPKGQPVTTTSLLLALLQRSQACNARQGGTSHEAVRLLFEELLERFSGEREGWFVKLDIPLTHQHIAMLVNCTRETISKTLADLREADVLDNSRFPYGVNPDKLL